MDPLTQFAALATAITNLVNEIVKGQTPEQKKIIWDWYITDMTRWRLWLKLDDPTQGARTK